VGLDSLEPDIVEPAVADNEVAGTELAEPDAAPLPTSDQEYCRKVSQTLGSIEKNVQSRNDLSRSLAQAIATRRSVVCIIIAMILPIIVWVYVLNNTLEVIWENGQLNAVRAAGLAATTAFLGVLVYMMVSKILGTTAGSKLIAPITKGVTSQFLTERAEVNRALDTLLNEDQIKNSKIPAKLLSAQGLGQLQHYFTSGQSEYIDDAVYMLEQDLSHVSHHQVFSEANTLVARQKAYLERYHQNPSSLTDDDEGR
jgi:hypothetical protein